MSSAMLSVVTSTISKKGARRVIPLFLLEKGNDTSGPFFHAVTNAGAVWYIRKNVCPKQRYPT
jgi:hypothetical protein